MSLLLQLFWDCEPGLQWKQLPSPQCKLRKQVAILQLISASLPRLLLFGDPAKPTRSFAADVLADCCLLYAPMRLFRSIMNRNLRKRLILIFSTCIMTTVVSLVHASFILISGGPREIIAAIVEVSNRSSNLANQSFAPGVD